MKPETHRRLKRSASNVSNTLTCDDLFAFGYKDALADSPAEMRPTSWQRSNDYKRGYEEGLLAHQVCYQQTTLF